MMRKIARKLASFFFRLHHWLERISRNGNKVAPYRLNYTPAPGKTRIIHFNGNFVIGGSSQLIADIIEHTSGEYDHHIIVPDHPHPLPYQPVSISAFPVTKLNQLAEFLRNDRPALVHIHYWVRPVHRFYDFGIWYAAVFAICEELGLKVIQNVNVPTRPFASPAIVHNVFVSHYVRNEFNDQSSVPSSVIYPGSNLTHFSVSSPHSLPGDTIGMVYRLDPDKLNAEAIEIFIEALKRKPELHCYIIGGGTFLRHYKKRVKEEGLSSRFVFTGYVPYRELPAFYRRIGLIVAPVHDESFGQVTPFAMGMGIPVAGYDTGALSEQLGSKETLVEYGNRSLLVNKILDLMNDPAKRQLLGEKNKERAYQEFNLPPMIHAYERLYKQFAF